MRWPTPYLRMKILGAIDYAQGKTIVERIKKVSGQTFMDEDGNPRSFTWRTISTWYYRYKHDGITGMKTKIRMDKGKTRKITPEELLEAINQVLPQFRKDQLKDNVENNKKRLAFAMQYANQLWQADTMYGP